LGHEFISSISVIAATVIIVGDDFFYWAGEVY